MLNKDSEIIDIPEENFKNNQEEIFELIHTTSHSILYRMKKDGKYFIVKQNALLEETGRRILRHEYEILIGLNHPNIVDIYEYRYSEDYGDQILMEYVDGRSLIEFLTEAPALKEKKRIFDELLEAVGYLHKNRIIHNDIKPENIIISKTGNRVMLIDLGVSDDDVNYAFKSIGFTQGFSAPELIKENKSDIRSDIYSLGIIFRILFGNRYSAISKKCLRHNPDKRFQNIDDLKRVWKRLYLRWLIPVLLIIILSISFFIGMIVKEWENEKIVRENLKEEITVQTREINRQKEEMMVQTLEINRQKEEMMVQTLEINRQKESYNDLKDQYETLKDSISMAQKAYKEYEQRKKYMLNSFSKQLSKATMVALDSFKTAKNYPARSAIRINYKHKIQSIYDGYPKIIGGEDLTPQLKLIFDSELEKLDQVYHSMLQ